MKELAQGHTAFSLLLAQLMMRRAEVAGAWVLPDGPVVHAVYVGGIPAKAGMSQRKERGGKGLASGLSLSRLGSRLGHVPNRWLHRQRCVHAPLRQTSRILAQGVDATGETPP